jgi:hypothetical protein
MVEHVGNNQTLGVSFTNLECNDSAEKGISWECLMSFLIWDMAKKSGQE